MKQIILGIGLGLLGFFPLSHDVDASQPFQPAYDLISISDSTPGGHGNVVQQMRVPAGDHAIGFLKISLPLNWDIASVQAAEDAPIVGSGQLVVDTSCDATPNTYPLTLTDAGGLLGDPPDVETNWFVQGYPFQQFVFEVKSTAAGQKIEAFLFSVGPAVCSPMTLDLTFQGISSDNPATPEAEGGRTVLTNPGAGVHRWSVEFQPYPASFPPVHTLTRCDEVGIGSTAPDTDIDGIANACDNCPSTANADQRDFDLDGTGDACDPDADNDGVCDVGGPLPDGTPGTPPGGCAAGPAGSDQCPLTPLTQRPVDVNGCSQAQVDQDLDGICDPGKSSPTLCTGSDNCPFAYNPSQADWNNNGIGDACEDSDSDGWFDNLDNCRSVYNPFQLDADADGAGNECDNCPSTYNPSQADFDNDGLGDACDPDIDGDGWLNTIENFVGTGNYKPCALTFTADDEADDGRPPDMNDDRAVTGYDLSQVAARIGLNSSDPNYRSRQDLTADNAITGADLSQVAAIIGSSC